MSSVLDDPRVQRALDRIHADGICVSTDEILAIVEDPHWDRAPLAHDWRKHVPPTMRDIWGTLPLHTRLCVYESAEYSALEEDLDSAMVTGPEAAIP